MKTETAGEFDAPAVAVHAGANREELMRVAWKDLNFTEKPGLHPIGEEWIDLKLGDIETWRKHPDAVFETTRFAAVKGRARHLLGSFEIPEE